MKKNKIKHLQKEVAGLQDIMRKNIEKVLQRGAEIDELKEKTHMERIEIINLRQDTKKINLKAMNSNYGQRLILTVGCIGCAISLLSGQPWPFHIIMFAVFGFIGYTINNLRYTLDSAWLKMKLFGENLLSKQSHLHTPSNQLHLQAAPHFLPSTPLNTKHSKTENAHSNDINYKGPRLY